MLRETIAISLGLFLVAVRHLFASTNQVTRQLFHVLATAKLASTNRSYGNLATNEAT